MKKLNFIFAYFALLSCVFFSCDKTGDMNLSVEEKNKRIVVNAIEEVWDRLDINLIDTYYADGYIEHNPTIETGKAGLQKAINDFKTQNISIHRDLARVIVEGDRVFAQSRIRYETNGVATDTIIVGDFFRIEDDKIKEHWSVSQTETPQALTVNGNSMIDGGGDPDYEISALNLARNKQNALTIMNEILVNNNVSIIPQYIMAPYTQHNPQVANGVAALEGFLNSVGALDIITYQTIAQGDLVVMFAHDLTFSSNGSAIVELFRFNEDGLAIEHWDIIQDVPNQAGFAHNNGFF